MVCSVEICGPVGWFFTQAAIRDGLRSTYPTAGQPQIIRRNDLIVMWGDIDSPFPIDLFLAIQGLLLAGGNEITPGNPGRSWSAPAELPTTRTVMNSENIETDFQMNESK